MKCVGWLHRDAAGKWRVALNGELKTDNPISLVAIGHIGDEAKPGFYQVAKVTDDAIGFVNANPEITDAKEGHLVYLEAKSASGG